MKFPFLLSEILRGQWSLEPHTALSYGAMVASLLSGDMHDFPLRSPWQYAFAASNGLSYGAAYDDAPAGSVAIVPLKGIMLKYGTLCSYGTSEIAAFLSAAFASKKIAAVVLDIDSGGGAVNAIPPITSLLQQSPKPVVALCDTAASAAYFVAACCPHIMADNALSAGFGSIGVVTSFADTQPYWELQGIRFHTVYAPESPHKNLAFERALKSDYELLQQEVLSPLAVQFQSHVLASRGNRLRADTPGVLSGKMFFAPDALRAGLIDSIGNMHAAVAKAGELAEVQKFLRS